MSRKIIALGVVAMAVSCSSPPKNIGTVGRAIDCLDYADFYAWQVPGMPCDLDSAPQLCILHASSLEPTLIAAVFDPDGFQMFVRGPTDDEQYTECKSEQFPLCREPLLIVPQNNAVGLPPYEGTEQYLSMFTCLECTAARTGWLRTRLFKQHVFRNNHYSLFDRVNHVRGTRERVFRNGKHVKTIIRDEENVVYWTINYRDGDIVDSWDDGTIFTQQKAGQ